MKMKGLLLAACITALSTPAGPAWADTVEIKIATLAPEGSAWAKIMVDGARRLAEKTQGRVTMKYFFSGSQGDERDAVRKMKLGQIDGAALTGTGLSLIASDVNMLELPFLFKSDKELDYVRSKMAPDFEKEFDKAGYVLLSWGDVGWVHLYSNIPVTSVEDLGKLKMWAWTDDVILRTFFKRLGMNGVPLGVPDVLPALQTGTIDACYGPPLAAVSFQWYTKVKYATEIPTNYAIGALILRKDVFTKLTPDEQKILRDGGIEVGNELVKVVRRDNERAKKAMVKAGVQIVPTPQPLIDKCEAAAREVDGDLAGGKVFSDEHLARLKKYLAEIRK
jgi:TRAP-type transport system periplasmic protein